MSAQKLWRAFGIAVGIIIFGVLFASIMESFLHPILDLILLVVIFTAMLTAPVLFFVALLYKGTKPTNGYSISDHMHKQDQILSQIMSGNTCDRCLNRNDDDCPWYGDANNRPVTCRHYRRA